jgi:ribose transport system substrate-binding protein
MVRRGAIALAWAGLLALGGCGDGEEAASRGEDAGGEQAQAQVGLVMKTLTNPFFVTMEQGARAAEADFDVELIVKTAAEETSIHQQIDIVDTLIREEQVDAIVIAPGDSVQLIPVLKTAQDRGIEVVNIDNRLDPEISREHGLIDVPFISVDNEKAAYTSAKYLADRLDTPTQAAVLTGIESAANSQARERGARRAFDAHPMTEIVAVESADWKVDKAYRVIQDVFARNPEIGAIFCANDMMAIGVLRYLEETGRTDVRVAAFDAIDQAKQAIREGRLTVTIDQLPDRQGYKGVATAVEMLRGATPPDEVMVDARVVDRAALERSAGERTAAERAAAD